jgi:N utilization substance protein B
LYELKFCPEVPYRVVINEAIEFAKAFGGSDGFKFINGVLNKAAKENRKEEFLI